MTPRRLLVAISAAQLAAGIAGLSVAVRRRRNYDRRASCAGRPEHVARDSLWPGDRLQRPGADAGRPGRGPPGACAGGRTTAPAGCSGCWGALMVPGYLMERYVRAHLRPRRLGPGRDAGRRRSRSRWPRRWPCSATRTRRGGRRHDGRVIRTPLTRWFDLTTPIIGAPMAGVTGGALARAVSLGGGLGMIGISGAASAEFVTEQCAIPAADEVSFGVGLMIWVLETGPTCSRPRSRRSRAWCRCPSAIRRPTSARCTTRASRSRAQVNTTADVHRGARGRASTSSSCRAPRPAGTPGSGRCCRCCRRCSR